MAADACDAVSRQLPCVDQRERDTDFSRLSRLVCRVGEQLMLIT